jgi:hypothetical protein
LKTIYEDPKHPYSFSSPYLLYQAAKKINSKIKLKHVKNWLNSQKSYTLYRNIINKFPRRKVLVPGIQHQFQADLLDYEPLKKENNNIRYLLTVIDCFSRKATAIPLKTKQGIVVLEGIKKAFKFLGIPNKLQTDLGTEFYNKNVQSFLGEKNVHHFSTDQELKAQMVERFNRTLREKIQKFMVSNNTLKYHHVLNDILEGYNNKIHSSLKSFSPNQVTKKNEKQVHNILYSDYLKKKRKKHKFKINDSVRIAAYRTPFHKSYHKNFTEEVFLVTDTLYTKPSTYKLRDQKNELLKGSFYEHQLQKVG